MKTIYLVAEGTTDGIVLRALIEHWLGDEEFLFTRIQPPESAYAEGLDVPLSNGWKGVLAWCAGERAAGRAGRDAALRDADCLIVHADADVAADKDFLDPPYAGDCPPARGACDWVHARLTSFFDGGVLPPQVVLCVPSKDLEAWVISALHPKVAEVNEPIECRAEPGALLVQLPPHRLVRRKDGALKKETSRYRLAAEQIATGWSNCVSGDPPRCPEAVRFEQETRRVLSTG